MKREKKLMCVKPIPYQLCVKSDDDDEIRFSVFTLNCWGLWGISKHRQIRMYHIAEYLSKLSSYTFIFLQEIWMTSDYLYLKEKLKHSHPYSIRFSAGLIGSGLCLFSKVPILHSFFFPFSTNGYFYNLFHGDWFSGKGVGICSVEYKGIKINLFTTHIHTETEGMEYVPHRITQFFSIIDLYLICTGTVSNVSIVAGDLNCEENGLLFKCLLYFTGLKDSFVYAPVKQSHITLCPKCTSHIKRSETFKEKKEDSFGLFSYCGHQGTCGIPSNAYASSRKTHDSQGSRLDYVLFANLLTDTKELKVLSYTRPLPSRIPYYSNLSYSDHEAVAVEFLYRKISSSNTNVSLQKNKSYKVQLYDTANLEQVILSHDVKPFNTTEKNDAAVELFDIICCKIKSLRFRIRFYLFFALFLLLILISFVFDKQCSGSTTRQWLNIAHILVSFSFFITAFIQPILLRQELHALQMGLVSLSLKAKIPAIPEAF
jgi:sphingomyelin phosphodiesterase 2